MNEGDPNGAQKRVGIRARTARRWLRRLGYRWQDVKKGVFIDGHERPDVVEYRKWFLDEMERLSPYFVEFTPSGDMKEKTYPSDSEVGGPNKRPIIVITHDESVFSANDGKHQAWVYEDSTILRPKGRGKGIMASDFLLPWSRLNLYSLPEARQQELQSAGIPLEAVVLFEYGKEEGYWDGKMLLSQVTERALPIAETLYPGYSFLFLFDNATSHSIYADDALRVNRMNKSDGGQQPFLRNGWFFDGSSIRTQEMSYIREDPSGNQMPTQKGIQRVLQERNLWPPIGLNLECPKPKCRDCQEMTTCKICIKRVVCDACRERKAHSSTCTAKRACDSCTERRSRCKCVPKKYCPACVSKQRGRCEECEQLPPKCTSEGELLRLYL